VEKIRFNKILSKIPSALELSCISICILVNIMDIHKLELLNFAKI